MQACKGHIPWATCICLVGQQAAILQQHEQVRQVVRSTLVTACCAAKALQAHFHDSWQRERVPSKGCMHMQHSVSPLLGSKYRAACHPEHLPGMDVSNDIHDCDVTCSIAEEPRAFRHVVEGKQGCHGGKLEDIQLVGFADEAQQGCCIVCAALR